MKLPRLLSLVCLLALGTTLPCGAGLIPDRSAPPSEVKKLAPGIVGSTWSWFMTERGPAKTTVTIHPNGTVTWADRPTLHSPYTVIDEYTIHQNQSTWKFSSDLQTLTVTSDPVPIRWGKRLR